MKNSDDPDIHLNLNVRGLPVSATLEINERSQQLIKQGRKIFKFGLGQSPFPVPKVVENELKKNAHQKDYLPVLGLYELRQAVADKPTGQPVKQATTAYLLKQLMIATPQAQLL